jgi:hypothetical protein
MNRYMIHKNVAAPSGVRFKKKIKKTVFTKQDASTNKYAQNGTVLMNFLNALKVEGLVYRGKDRECFMKSEIRNTIVEGVI